MTLEEKKTRAILRLEQALLIMKHFYISDWPDEEDIEGPVDPETNAIVLLASDDWTVKEIYSEDKGPPPTVIRIEATRPEEKWHAPVYGEPFELDPKDFV